MPKERVVVRNSTAPRLVERMYPQESCSALGSIRRTGGTDEAGMAGVVEFCLRCNRRDVGHPTAGAIGALRTDKNG